MCDVILTTAAVQSWCGDVTWPELTGETDRQTGAWRCWLVLLIYCTDCLRCVCLSVCVSGWLTQLPSRPSSTREWMIAGHYSASAGLYTARAVRVDPIDFILVVRASHDDVNTRASVTWCCSVNNRTAKQLYHWWVAVASAPPPTRAAVFFHSLAMYSG